MCQRGHAAVATWLVTGSQEEAPAWCLRSSMRSPSDALAACDWPCWARRAVWDQHQGRRFVNCLFVFLEARFLLGNNSGFP